MGFNKRPAIETGPDGCLYVPAPAKVNLFLHITGRRDDGYHLLESLFVFTRRGDLLRLQSSDTFSFSVTGHHAENLSDTSADQNLVVKAAQVLSQHAGVPCKVQIELEKNLPVAAGLGGGSADAAAALIGLRKLWQLNIADDDLLKLALELGADVPSCLYSESVIVRGIGENIKPHALPWSSGILIVNPNIAVSTQTIFKGFRNYRQQRGLPPFDIAINDINSVTQDVNALNLLTSNSLEDPVRFICPQVAEVQQFLKQNSQSDFVRMTGSGASVVALYHSKEAAQAVARRVREHAPHWWVMADEIS